MKRLLGIFLAVFLLGAYGVADSAYPDKPIKVIIGYEPGSATDISARALLPLVEKELGQSMMIINKPGAASAMALREVYDSKPDGYIIGVSCSVNVLKIQGLLPHTHHDFDILSVPYLTWCVVGVPSKGPFKSAKELVDYAKANPEKVRMSTTAKGALYWIQVKYLEQVTGTKFKIMTNPGGGAFVATQIGGNHADAGLASYKVFQSQIDAGNIRILGITTSQRVPGFPNLPTLKEQGFDMVIDAWGSYVAPKGLQPDIYKKLLSAFSKASSSKEWQNWCASKATLAAPEYIGEEAVKFLDRDAEKVRPILLEAMKK
jgi:tripartite-type tricarboxylate transporter receptor subunit TctC